jgi:hypothetical protein
MCLYFNQTKPVSPIVEDVPGSTEEHNIAEEATVGSQIGELVSLSYLIYEYFVNILKATGDEGSIESEMVNMVSSLLAIVISGPFLMFTLRSLPHLTSHKLSLI